MEIRRRFGVPVGRLGRVIEALRGGKTDMLVEAACLTAETAAPVWLVTDLEETCVLRTAPGLAAFLGESPCRGDTPAGFLLIKVSPLVKRLVARLREKEIPSGVKRMLERPEEEAMPCTPQEAEVLRLIRSGEYRSIEVVMQDGAIQTLHTAPPVAELEPEQVADLIREHDYQSVTVTRRGGRKRVIEQRVARKAAQVAIWTPSRRREAPDTAAREARKRDAHAPQGAPEPGADSRRRTPARARPSCSRSSDAGRFSDRSARSRTGSWRRCGISSTWWTSSRS